MDVNYIKSELKKYVNNLEETQRNMFINQWNSSIDKLKENLLGLKQKIEKNKDLDKKALENKKKEYSSYLNRNVEQLNIVNIGNIYSYLNAFIKIMENEKNIDKLNEIERWGYKIKYNEFILNNFDKINSFLDEIKWR